MVNRDRVSMQHQHLASELENIRQQLSDLEKSIIQGAVLDKVDISVP